MNIRSQQGQRGRRQQHSFVAKAFLRRQAIRQLRPVEPPLENLADRLPEPMAERLRALSANQVAR